MNIFFLSTLFLLSSFALSAHAQTENTNVVQEEILPIGEVRYLRGKALRNGETLSEGNNVFEGDTIKTLASSVVKIAFNNESLVTIAPESEMVLEEFEGADENLIHLLKGVMRAKVKKNPINKENSLVIKSQTAALGVRGTDFQFTYNQTNRISSVLTFSGIVAFKKIPSAKFNYSDLDGLLSQSNTKEVLSGEFSANNPKTGNVNVPTKINTMQFHALRKNISFRQARAPRTASKNYRSVIPRGAPSKAFKSRSRVRFSKRVSTRSKNRQSKENKIEGFYDKSAGEYAPAAGGYLDQKTGIYIQPDANSTLIEEQGIYNPSPKIGTINPKTGEYIPPKGFQLTPKGDFKPINPKFKLPPPPKINFNPESFGDNKKFINGDLGEVKKSFEAFKKDSGMDATNQLNQIQNEINLQNNQQATTKSNTTFLILEINER